MTKKTVQTKEPNNTLYELTGMYLELLRQCETIDMTEEDNLTAIHDTFDSLDVVINDKLEGCSKIVKQLEGEIHMIKDEEDRLKSRRESITRNMENLKEYMLDNMKKLDIDKIDTGLFKIGVTKNGGLRKLNMKVEPEKLPEAAKKLEVKADTKAIRNMIKANPELENSEWWELEPQGQHLSIR